jgi:hypothetical protein
MTSVDNERQSSKRSGASSVLTTLLILLSSIAAMSSLVAGCTSQETGVGPPPVVLGVDDVAADPMAYDGPIVVEGVVSFVDAVSSTFVIIDVSEYELCGVVDCAINEIPVPVPAHQYDGTLPVVRDFVLVHGEMVDSGTGYSLDAAEVQKGGEPILKKRTEE